MAILPAVCSPGYCTANLNRTGYCAFSCCSYRYERCRGVQQVFNLEAGDAVDLFEIQPFNHSSGSAADNLVDLVRFVELAGLAVLQDVFWVML